MTLGQALRLSVQRMDIVIYGVIFGVMLGVAYAKLGSSVYLSTAEVILSVQTPQNVTSATLADQLSPEYLFTQVDILESDQVALMAAEALGLLNKADAGPNAKPEVREQALHVARALRLNMRVVAGAGFSRVIDIQYTAGTAAFAAAAANKFAEAFQATHLGLQAEPARDAAGFYNEQVDKLAQNLRTAQIELITRQRALGIPVANIGSVESEVGHLQALGGELASAQRLQADAAARGGTPLPDTLNNGAIQNLQVQIAQARGQRDQLLATAGAQNPQVIALNAQISALEGAQRGTQAQLSAAAAQTAAVQAASVRNLSNTLADQKGKAIGERAKAAELDRLVREVNTRQVLYDQGIARRADLQLAGTSENTDVAILSAALPPATPIWPNTKIVVAAAAIVGGVLGAFGSFILQIFAQRMRKRSDLELWLGIEALAEIRLDNGAKTAGEPAPLLIEGTDVPAEAEVGPVDWPAPAPADPAGHWEGNELWDAPRRQLSDPVSEELFAWHRPESIATDDLRNVRTALLMPAKAAGGSTPVIAFISNADDERRVTLLANLAILFAKAGSRTLLIDGDLGGAAIDDLFGIDHVVGLSDYLETGHGRVASTVFADLPDLTIVSGGAAPRLNDDALASRRLAALIADARQHFEFILINTPAASRGGDYMLIARLAAFAIFVTLQKVTRVREAAMILNALDEAGIRLLGGLFISRPRTPWRQRLRPATLFALPRRLFRRRAEAVSV